VTFSGGEPFQQASAVAAVARVLQVQWPEASLMAFSGYRFEELRGPTAPPGAEALLTCLDLLVEGRFDPKLPGNRAWRGSRNQRVWVLGRPLPPERPAGLQSELHIAPDGQVLLSGFPDAQLRRAVKALQ
jgi:anaerobic ribonucleoside-triphosphate reductase activating protein